MQYQYTSLKSVIGNVIRNTRLQDASYIADIHEWLYEAMDMLETKVTLEGKYKNIRIEFHKAPLPCGLRYIDGVEYHGRRLRWGGGVRPAARDRNLNYSDMGNPAFESMVDKKASPDGTGAMYETSIKAMNNLPQCVDNEYYFTDMGTINTSFPAGELTIYYRGVKTDDDGFPMIPDLQDYKQALYWYCRAMMIGAGWEDAVFKYEHCIQQWEKIYAPRALAQMRMPSVEKMERSINTFVRFIPNAGYYDSFFDTPYREDPFDIRSRLTGITNNNANNGTYVQQPYIVGTKPLEDE